MNISERFPTVAPWPGQDDGDEGRTARGWHIAASTPYVKVPGGWITPSQSNPGVYYHLALDEDGPYCSCPDQEAFCKHVRGLQFMLERERKAREISESLGETQGVQEPQRRFVMSSTEDPRATGPADADSQENVDPTPTNLNVPIRIVRRVSSRGPSAPARRQIAPGTEDHQNPTYQQDWPGIQRGAAVRKGPFSPFTARPGCVGG